MIIAPSRGILDELQHCLKGAAIPAVLIPNVVDVTRVPVLPPRQRAPHPGRIIAMGRFVAWKRFDLVLHALSLLPRGSAELHLVGDGPERGALERLAGDLGVRECTRFHGYRADPFPLLTEASFGVLPSQFEPFGNVIIEMFAAGLPVVAFDVDYGPREIIRDGENGILLRDRTPGHLAEAMAGLLLDFARLKRLGANARKEAERHYGVERAVRSYEECFALLRSRVEAVSTAPA